MLINPAIYCLLLLASCHARHSRRFAAFEAAPALPSIESNASAPPSEQQPAGPEPVAVGQTPAVVAQTPAVVGQTPAVVGQTPAVVEKAAVAVGAESAPTGPASFAPIEMPSLNMAPVSDTPGNKFKQLGLMESLSAPNGSIDDFGKMFNQINPGFPKGAKVSKNEQETEFKTNDQGEPIRVITSKTDDEKPKVRTELVHPAEQIPSPAFTGGGVVEDDEGIPGVPSIPVNSADDDDTDSP